MWFLLCYYFPGSQKVQEQIELIPNCSYSLTAYKYYILNVLKCKLKQGITKYHSKIKTLDKKSPEKYNIRSPFG